jgi:hypothetical protein
VDAVTDPRRRPRLPTGPPRLRVTRRGRRILLAVALALTLLTGGVAVRLLGVPDAWLPAALHGPRCTLTTPDGVQPLELDAARRLTSTALAAVTTGGRPATTHAAPAAAATTAADQTEAAHDATALAALRTADAALNCRLSGAERRARKALPRQPEGPAGLTPRADAVRRAMLDAGGTLPLGGYAPGGVTTGHMPGSAHYEGRAIDVFFRPVSAANSRHGWLLAQWLVAHAGELDVQNVIFDDRIWSASASSSGWRPYVPPQGISRNPVLRHLDHVHVDVVQGVGTAESPRPASGNGAREPIYPEYDRHPRRQA